MNYRVYERTGLLGHKLRAIREDIDTEERKAKVFGKAVIDGKLPNEQKIIWLEITRIFLHDIHEQFAMAFMMRKSIVNYYSWEEWHAIYKDRSKLKAKAPQASGEEKSE